MKIWWKCNDNILVLFLICQKGTCVTCIPSFLHKKCFCNIFEDIDITTFKQWISNKTSQILLKFWQHRLVINFLGCLYMNPWNLTMDPWKNPCPVFKGVHGTLQHRQRILKISHGGFSKCLMRAWDRWPLGRSQPELKVWLDDSLMRYTHYTHHTKFASFCLAFGFKDTFKRVLLEMIAKMWSIGNKSDQNPATFSLSFFC